MLLVIKESSLMPNALNSGKRVRFGAASEWFSADLTCYKHYSIFAPHL
jgi:hypothetical protein